MEAKRKMEELERRRQEDEDLRAAVALQVFPNLHVAQSLAIYRITKSRFTNLS